jgi:hypothetical protein
MLSAGSSLPWPQTLYHLTGEREMTASAIIDYFDPLKKWLFTYRQAHNYQLGWKKSGKKEATVGAKKTINNDRLKVNSDSSNSHRTKGDVSFPAAKNSNDGLNLPDLKTALEEMQPNNKQTSKKSESLLEAKSSIKARPMFLPNKVKDQLNLG